MAELSRFYSTKSENKLTSLDAYIERMGKDQKAIYYITGDDAKTLACNPLLEAFREKDIEVLLLTDPIDEFWTQTLLSYKASRGICFLTIFPPLSRNRNGHSVW